MAEFPKEIDVGSVITLAPLEGEKFVVGSIISGGMGTVYQLIPVGLNRQPIALKSFTSLTDRGAFMREVAVWVSLASHPYVARALFYTEVAGRACVVADWYSRSLAEVGIRNWPSAKIVAFASMLVEALQFAYSRGVVHQDIKPSNVMLDENDRPRLADFGLARYAGDTGASDIKRPSFLRNPSNSLSLGRFGGTPFFMAPELLSGQTTIANIKTDMFSLGTTLYFSLTNAHPYIDVKKGVFRPFVEMGPLDRLIKERGVEIKPVITLVTDAIQLKPMDRPDSYLGLLSTMHRSNFKPTARVNNAEEAVTQAAYLRSKGRGPDALRVISDALQIEPVNPLLLNAYAANLIQNGRIDEAVDVLVEAVECLAHLGGRRSGRLYLDPVANLAGLYLRREAFGSAQAILHRALAWTTAADGDLITEYPEFGWLLLYDGEFGRACQHIMARFRSRQPDEASLLWLTLAAWLSGDFGRYSGILGECYLKTGHVSIREALCICVVATAKTGHMRAKLTNRAFEAHRVAINSLAEHLGLKPHEFLPPVSAAASKTVVRSLDAAVTGGKYYDVIG